MSRQGVALERNRDNMKGFWKHEAREWGDDPRVTIRDHYFRLLETRSITEIIRGRRKVLDIACGSGFSTLYFGEVVDEITGMDYVDDMVTCAQRFLSDTVYFNKVMDRFACNERPKLRGNIRFETADILDMPYAPGSFDAVTTSRALINLPKWELQVKAIDRVAKILKPKGVWALAEVTQQGHEQMDRIRQSFQLPILEKYWHNLYIDEPGFQSAAKKAGLAVRQIQRFETYQFLTKVIHPLIVAPREPKFLDGFNKAALTVSRLHPTYQSVVKMGVDKFFLDIFKSILAIEDPGKLDDYARLVPKILKKNLDFTGCSHQVLFVLSPL